MPDLGIPTPLPKIDGALRELWDNNEAVTRASLINFAIYSESTDCIEHNTSLIQEITKEHACRALLVASKPDAPHGSVSAWITAHCKLDGSGKKSVCSEQVTFEIPGADAARIRNIVFAHLESDLPLVFWWQGSFTSVFESRLYSLIDRLIIDSAQWSDPLPQFDQLEASIAHSSSRFILYDLNWARLLHVRLAIAGIFDDARALAALPDISKVSITHGPAHRLTAVFLCAWLVERTGWKLVGGDTLAFQSKGGGKHISCQLLATAEMGAPISRLDMETPDSSFSIDRDNGEPFLKTTIQTPGYSTTQLCPSSPDDPAALTIEQLQRGSNNPAYFHLLPTVRQIWKRLSR